MRAKLPGKDGFVDRDGVKIHYEVYGDGPETMVFLPPWSIVHARVYKAQLPYFSERFRCITFDPRGNGKSDQPTEAAAYTLDNYIGDILAVMDATDAGKAILVGLSLGGMHVCVLAAHHPERVKAAVLAGTAATVGPGYPYLTPEAFHGQARAVRGLGQVQPRLLAGALSRLRRALRAQHLLRSALDQADRGRHRMGQRDHGPGAGQDGGGTLDPAGVRCRRGHVPQDQMPHADDPRRQRPDPALCPRAGRGRAHGRGARHHSGRRAQSAGPLSGEVQRADQRFPGSQARHSRAQAARQRGAQEPRRRSISRPPSASGTGVATSPSRANCASCIPICRSTGWRRTL